MSFRELNCIVKIVKYEDTEYNNKEDVYQFDNVVKIITDEDFNVITNYAKIELVKNKIFVDKNGELRSADEIFNIGDMLYIIMNYKRMDSDQPRLDQGMTFNESGIEISDFEAFNRYFIFTGFIAHVVQGDTIILECENEMWWLQNKTINFPADAAKVIGEGKNQKVEYWVDEYEKFDNIQNVSLIKFFTHILKDIKLPTLIIDEQTQRTKIEEYPLVIFALSEMNLGTLKFDGLNVSQIFNKLKKAYNIPIYFKWRTLFIGNMFQYDSKIPQTYSAIPFALGVNIINDNNLKYRRLEDYKLGVHVKIYGISNTKIYMDVRTIEDDTYDLYVPNDNTPQTIKDNLVDFIYGDRGPQASKKDAMVWYDLTEDMVESNGKIKKDSQKYLLDHAKALLKQYKYEGYTGSFTTFGEAVVYPNDVVEIIDARILNKDGKPVNKKSNGKYLVKSVKRTYDASGAKYRQEIELGYRLYESPDANLNVYKNITYVR